MEQRKYTQNREIENRPVEQGIEGKDAEQMALFPKITPCDNMSCGFSKTHMPQGEQ